MASAEQRNENANGRRLRSQERREALASKLKGIFKSSKIPIGSAATDLNQDKTMAEIGGLLWIRLCEKKCKLIDINHKETSGWTICQITGIVPDQEESPSPKFNLTALSKEAKKDEFGAVLKPNTAWEIYSLVQTGKAKEERTRRRIDSSHPHNKVEIPETFEAFVAQTVIKSDTGDYTITGLKQKAMEIMKKATEFGLTYKVNSEEEIIVEEVAPIERNEENQNKAYRSHTEEKDSDKAKSTMSNATSSIVNLEKGDLEILLDENATTITTETVEIAVEREQEILVEIREMKNLLKGKTTPIELIKRQKIMARKLRNLIAARDEVWQEIDIVIEDYDVNKIPLPEDLIVIDEFIPKSGRNQFGLMRMARRITTRVNQLLKKL